MNQKRALEVARDYAVGFDQHRAVGRCLVFCGKPGTGKTLLASIVGTNLIRSNHTAFYSTAIDLVRWIRSGWRKDAIEDDASILLKIQKFDLLILDEIGVQFGSDAEVQQLTEVIDKRYQETRPTLVISNHSLKEMANFLSERGVDRLRENGGKVVIFDWESFRGKEPRRSCEA